MPDDFQQQLFSEENNEQLPLANLKLSNPLVFFDLETTGLDMRNDRIVQFAFLKVNPDHTQDEWMELVNPGRPIPPEASRVHQITDEMVADKPRFADFAPLIVEFLKDCDLAGFNIVRFDVPFLQAELQRAGQSLDFTNMRLLDAQVIYHKNEPRTLSAAYRFYCNREHIDAHDAMADVRATLEILDAQLSRYDHLPKDTAGLHNYCSAGDSRYVTGDRKFIWKDDQAAIAFGKHKGKSLQWMVENEPDYLRWMQNGDFTQETKKVIADAFAGRFPSRNSD